jgi:outer membrane protein OmpA-like peptidoglycan-associated protein
MTTRDSLMAMLIFLLTLSGCAQKTASTEPSAPPAASAPIAEQPAAPEARAPDATGPAPRSVSGGGPTTPASPSTASAPQSADKFTDEPALQDVFFEPARADVGRNGVPAIRSNVRWIVENPGALVLVEGHSDYKGSAEANRAMGERRATAVVSLLSRKA